MALDHVSNQIEVCVYVLGFVQTLCVCYLRQISSVKM